MRNPAQQNRPWVCLIPLRWWRWYGAASKLGCIQWLKESLDVSDQRLSSVVRISQRTVKRRLVNSGFIPTNLSDWCELLVLRSTKYGARWNQKGTAVVYCSESASLAQLEVLVRTQRARDLALYVLIEAHVPEELIETLQREDLPDDWNALPESNTTREMGTKWAMEKRSAILGVPSVVIPNELNFLLNPEHPDFSKIETGTSNRVGWDPRLLALLSKKS
jgi:RES domain-containing protein